MDAIFLKAIQKNTIWGGERFGLGVGELWLISAHPNGCCLVLGGEFAGMRLDDLYAKRGDLFDNKKSFPLLIKLIDAKEDLSLQVHPDNHYAGLHEQSFGKSESWLMLDCKEGAKIILGHNAKDEKELKSMIEQQKWPELLREVEVFKQDYFHIPPGTLHAIGAGCFLLEVQQNSDVTYRVWDFDRGRELHTKKALDVLKAPSKPKASSANSQSEFFKTNILTAPCVLSAKEGFLCCVVIEGFGLIKGQRELGLWDAFLLPKGEEIELEGELKLFIASAL